jgi:hypothetical protein
MNNRLSKVWLAVTMLVVASLACSLTGGPLVQDDFEGGSIEWGTGTDSDSSVEYGDGGLRMKVFVDNYIVWSSPNVEAFDEAIHIEVTVKTNGSDPLTGFAIICQLQEYTDSFYYLAITPNGDYAIADKSLALDSIYLTANQQWETSEKIGKNKDSYRLGADCGSGTLTLYVDGQLIDSVSDSTYTSGGVGLMLWSDVDIQKVDVTFDDFLVTKPGE